MPTLGRQPGIANVSGITVIRLIPITESLNMNTVITWDFLYKDEVWSVFNDAPSDGIYTFPQLNDTASLKINAITDIAGLSYDYELSWRLPRNRIEAFGFLSLLDKYDFIVAVADGNQKFMVLGQIHQPFEVSADFSSDATSYAFTAKARCSVPPLFVEGITNHYLYYGTNDLT